MKTAGAVRVALVLAALLSVGSSIGLHPEPSGVPSSPVTRFAAASGMESASHCCLACLTHASALVSPLAGILQADGRVSPSAHSADPTPHARLSGRDLSGRSPPALS